MSKTNNSKWFTGLLPIAELEKDLYIQKTTILEDESTNFSLMGERCRLASLRSFLHSKGLVHLPISDNGEVEIWIFFKKEALKKVSKILEKDFRNIEQKMDVCPTISRDYFIQALRDYWVWNIMSQGWICTKKCGLETIFYSKTSKRRAIRIKMSISHGARDITLNLHQSVTSWIEIGRNNFPLSEDYKKQFDKGNFVMLHEPVCSNHCYKSLNEFDTRCNVLPSLNSARIVGIGKKYPTTEDDLEEKSLEEYWNYVHGIKVKQMIQEKEVNYCKVHFDFSDKYFTYPTCCLLKAEPQILSSASKNMSQSYIEELINCIRRTSFTGLESIHLIETHMEQEKGMFVPAVKYAGVHKEKEKRVHESFKISKTSTTKRISAKGLKTNKRTKTKAKKNKKSTSRRKKKK